MSVPLRPGWKAWKDPQAPNMLEDYVHTSGASVCKTRNDWTYYAYEANTNGDAGGAAPIDGNPFDTIEEAMQAAERWAILRTIPEAQRIIEDVIQGVRDRSITYDQLWVNAKSEIYSCTSLLVKRSIRREKAESLSWKSRTKAESFVSLT